ncbi:galectin-3 isoform X2 [Bufo bufo]|uniref:galectin-3 isoform X2 n=1 Tax=Bufo bufo TaxID=8384 RepID=UPI001ABEE0BC|nr:galectin-3 isoform X2 [Bufo bufo]
MSDGFSLDDALSGQGNANTQQSQNLNNPWGGQNPGQQYPGFPGPGQGQQYPGFPGPGQAQQFPGPGQGQGQPQQFPGPGQGQQYPGFPPGGQQYPGMPAGGQQYPGYPGFPGPGQSYPGAPTAGQTVPSAPSGPMKVPCEIPLPVGCTKGLMLNISGVPNGKRFVIDFKEGNDIALHFNPRFDENPNVIVRNTMTRGQWGKEERECPKFPFQKGQPFRLQILFEPEAFKVAVNNENICQYKHRLRNFSGIKSICISGDVTITDTSLTTV